jgi:hypothetical protein
VNGGAVFSPCYRYRYVLTREWERGEGTVNFIMLNPSTADALTDDPTIRRCIGFARQWGYRTLTVTNLYGLRATDPRELQRAEDPIGPRNDEELANQARLASLVVCAWGTYGLSRGGLVRRVLQGTLSPFIRVSHLGLTQAGAPRHPLYLAADTPLAPYLQGAAQ